MNTYLWQVLYIYIESCIFQKQIPKNGKSLYYHLWQVLSSNYENCPIQKQIPEIIGLIPLYL